MTTLLDTLRQRLDSDAIAFRLVDGGTVHYDAFDRLIDAVERALTDRGANGSRRVAVAMPRSPFGLALFLGVASRNICCPMNPGLKSEEVIRFVEATEAELIVADWRNAAVAEAAAARSIPLLTFDLAQSDAPLFVGRGPDLLVADPPLLQPTPYAILLQTSGTTSKPKTVLIKHSQVLATIHGIIDAFNLQRTDVCLNPMPFQHLHGLVTAGLASLMSGSASICLPSFSPETFMAAFEEFRPTWFTGSPAMHIALLDHFRRGARPLPTRCLRFLRSSSAPLPSTIIAELETCFGAPLIETYGLTETATMIATNPLPPEVRKVGSVGVPCAGAEIAVTDDGKLLFYDTPEGEILVRGPSVITHYGMVPHDDPENFRNGWLRTGDIGKIDADGYLFISGRSKELIKRGGLSVYPGEVDNALMALPDVADAATFSIPHPSLGEDVVSIVVPAPTANFSESAVRASLFQKLSSYKIPSDVIVVDEIPKGETGKIVRRSLSEWFTSRLSVKNERPQNELEHRLLTSWSAALYRDDLGVTDNLFIFGADPIISDRIQNAIFTPMGLERGFAFKYPTVRMQADQIEHVRPGSNTELIQ